MSNFSGPTKKDLIERLENETEVLRKKELKDAFNAIDRKDFVPKEYLSEAYEDYPLPIGYGQTISQPTTVAFMLELLEPLKGEKILDVGSGSGWTTALLAHMVGNKGLVLGVEVVPELAGLGQENIKKYDFKQASIIQAKDNKVGFSGKAPFDKILVSAAAEEVPKELVEQLRDGGIMVIPVADSIWRIVKNGEKTDVSKFPGFIFVPLIT
jgi:protein-L-isoaspartate(D-aspartate) O-methyltransferase